MIADTFSCFPGFLGKPPRFSLPCTLNILTKIYYHTVSTSTLSLQVLRDAALTSCVYMWRLSFYTELFIAQRGSKGSSRCFYFTIRDTQSEIKISCVRFVPRGIFIRRVISEPEHLAIYVQLKPSWRDGTGSLTVVMSVSRKLPCLRNAEVWIRRRKSTKVRCFTTFHDVLHLLVVVRCRRFDFTNASSPSLSISFG